MSKERFVLVPQFVGAMLLVVAALAAAACGSSDEAAPQQQTESAQQAEEPVELSRLKIGLYPAANYAALYAGIKEGIFEKHGLELEIRQILTGSGLMAALTSGEVDLATNSVTAGVTGILGALPIRIVTGTDLTPTEGNTEVLVKQDSAIRDFGDLAGKTVATINLQGQFQMGVLAAVEAAGGDPSTVTAVPMSPVDEPTALAAGRLDAIVLQEPFVTQAQQQYDLRSLGNPFGTLDFRLPAGAFFSDNATIEEKGETLRAFVEAMEEATELTRSNPDLARDVLPEYTDLSKEDAQEIALPEFDTTIAEDDLAAMMERMKSYGWISDVPSYEDVVWRP